MTSREDLRGWGSDPVPPPRQDVTTPPATDAAEVKRIAVELVANTHEALGRLESVEQSLNEIDAMLAETGLALDVVLEITADAEAVVARLLKRAEVENRPDDTEDVIRERQAIYRRETEPLAAVFRAKGLLVEVDGMGDVDEVSERIFSALES
mgnify:CR=1 FL=1